MPILWQAQNRKSSQVLPISSKAKRCWVTGGFHEAHCEWATPPMLRVLKPLPGKGGGGLMHFSGSLTVLGHERTVPTRALPQIK